MSSAEDNAYVSSIADLKAQIEQLTLRPPTEKQQRSIAVLPFANMSRDEDDEYFSDGLAEEIINALAKIPDLKVIARTLSLRLQGTEHRYPPDRGNAGCLQHS